MKALHVWKRVRSLGRLVLGGPIRRRRPASNPEAAFAGPSRRGLLPVLPPLERRTQEERAALLATISPSDLFDQISTADIRLRVLQTIDRLRVPVNKSFARDARRNRLNPVLCFWDAHWDSWCALLWYAWRFQPTHYLEVSDGHVETSALVATASPDCRIDCFDRGRPIAQDPEVDEMAALLDDLRSCGYQNSIQHVRGNSRSTLRRYLRGKRCPGVELARIDGGGDVQQTIRHLAWIADRLELGGMIVVETAGMDQAELTAEWQASQARRQRKSWQFWRKRHVPPTLRSIDAPVSSALWLFFRVA